MKMKYYKYATLIIFIFILCIIINPFDSNAQNESQCVECHTSAKKVIEITREIAKTKPTEKAAEQEGEG